MACCLTTASHYLYQCWLRSKTLLGLTSPQWLIWLMKTKVCHHGGHYWDCVTGTLSYLVSHWYSPRGRVTHTCVSKITTIGLDNGLSLGRRQATIWTSAGILLIGPLGTNFSEILIEIQTYSLKAIRWKMSSAKCQFRRSRPQCVKERLFTVVRS